jgi:Sec-independent protein translocase protein TatA
MIFGSLQIRDETTLRAVAAKYASELLHCSSSSPSGAVGVSTGGGGGGTSFSSTSTSSSSGYHSSLGGPSPLPLLVDLQGQVLGTLREMWAEEEQQFQQQQQSRRMTSNKGSKSSHTLQPQRHTPTHTPHHQRHKNNFHNSPSTLHRREVQTHTLGYHSSSSSTTANNSLHQQHVIHHLQNQSRPSYTPGVYQVTTAYMVSNRN